MEESRTDEKEDQRSPEVGSTSIEWQSYSDIEIQQSKSESDLDVDLPVEKRAYRPHRQITIKKPRPEMPTNPRIDTTNVDWESVEPVAEHQHHSPLTPGHGFDSDPEPTVVDYDGLGATVVKFTQSSSSGRSKSLGFGPDFDRLARLNEGRHSATGDLSTRTSKLDKIRITQAFCSTLDVPRHQMNEAARIMLLLDLNQFGNQKRLNRVALGVINVVVNWHRFQIRQNPHANRINRTTDFQKLMHANDVDESDLNSLRRITKRELRSMDYFNSERD